MGDMSEMRGVITVVVFLGVFVTLLGLLFATPFGVISQELRNVTVPTTWEGLNVASYNFTETWNGTLRTDTGSGNDFMLGGKYWHLEEYWAWAWSDFKLWLWDGDIPEWWLDSQNRGIELWSTQLAADMGTSCNITYSLRIPGDGEMTAIFSYDTDLYPSSWHAFWNYDLQILIGVKGILEGATIMNVWDIIGMLLFFQLPDMGAANIFGILLSFGIWACLGYLIFIFALRVVGAVFGGGGA